VNRNSAEIPEWLPDAVDRLLPEPHGLVRLEPLAGGANNRVFRVRAQPQDVLLKWYFTDPADGRDRLRAEWEFIRFARHGGLRQLPEALACDTTHRLALYEFIVGRRLQASQITREHVQGAADFIRSLNELRASTGAAQLNTASEACFSIKQHLDCVAARVQRLAQAVRDGDADQEARDFVNLALAPGWQRLRARTQARAAVMGLDPNEELPPSNRIISPSDFGFHNALVDAEGSLRFFDFEYAGWDDPAKTICDFFCQVAVPVPHRWLALFASELLEDTAECRNAHTRAELLLPVYQIKWCCILLNPLLGVGRRRRAFSRGETIDADRTEAPWLAEARRILSEVHNTIS
jgi:hypothetical protein